jgi:hypothetical protein
MIDEKQLDVAQAAWPAASPVEATFTNVEMTLDTSGRAACATSKQ